MKKVLIVCLLSQALLACNSSDPQGVISNWVSQDQIVASGPTSEKSFKVSFESVRVSTSIDAEIIQSNRQEVVISAPQSILDKVLVDSRGSELHITFKPGTSIRGVHKVRAKIYTNKLAGVTADSSADIVIQSKFTQERMHLKASSSGSITGDVEANDLVLDVSSSGDYSGRIWALNLTAEASSSGDLKLSGKARNANLKASSSGDIKAESLVVEDAQIKASSSGDVKVAVSQRANASASSSGDVTILRKGNVILTRHASSGGSVSMN